ncbi:MAG: hypothetical protein AAF564_26295 [Bacteroidota bacterium]
MENTTLIPIVAAVLFVAYGLYMALRKADSNNPQWQMPALLSVLFLLFSIYTVTMEGATGFAIEHTRNLWGNQITFDLLLAVGAALYFAIPRAKTLGMQPLFWLLLIASTGSIGLLAMLARIVYLENKVGIKQAIEA